MSGQPLWPIVAYAALAIIALGGLVGLSALLGERHSAPGRDVPYESGMRPTGSPRVRLAPQYYLVAMLFVVFDVEGAFLYAWALAAREAGWSGLVEVGVFIGVLLVALVWLVRLGALDWAPTRRELEA